MAGWVASESGMHALLKLLPVKEFGHVSRTYEMIMAFDLINPLLEIIRNVISCRDFPCSSTIALLASPIGTLVYHADTLLDHSDFRHSDWKWINRWKRRRKAELKGTENIFC